MKIVPQIALLIRRTGDGLIDSTLPTKSQSAFSLRPDVSRLNIPSFSYQSGRNRSGNGSDRKTTENVQE